jgi:hypothetical protein
MVFKALTNQRIRQNHAKECVLRDGVVIIQPVPCVLLVKIINVNVMRMVVRGIVVLIRKEIQRVGALIRAVIVRERVASLMMIPILL